MTQVTVPPIESLAALARSIRCVIASDVSVCGQRVRNLSTSARVTVDNS